MHRTAEQARGLPAAPGLSAHARRQPADPPRAQGGSTRRGGRRRDRPRPDRRARPRLRADAGAARAAPPPRPADPRRAPRRRRAPGSLPRSQGEEGTCGGQALAALIDLQRIAAKVAEPYPVSARMIYQCARLKRDAGADDGVSLRDVIKGFYNYGVCRDALWPYAAGGEPGQLSIERARDAKNLSLGAYYRLRPNLNTYHAALHETGALLVSAELHDGWRHDRVRAAQGTIVAPRPGQPRGALGAERHAFVVLGYTPAGFLVLNSWGRDWGGWTPADAAPVPGLALWRYDDWADTIMDGWVLRLGVGAAEAFEFSIGDQGLGFGAEAPTGALDPGARHPRQLPPPRRRRLRRLRRLRLHPPHARGDPAPARGGRRHRRSPTKASSSPSPAGSPACATPPTTSPAGSARCSDAGWYPFTVLWCVDYVEQVRTVLEGVFAEAGKRAGGPGPRLDRVVEELAHGIGRALWRDIGRAAERAARPGGPLHDLAHAGAGLAAKRPGFGLRIVTESEGAIALAALLRAMRTRALRRRGRPLLRDAGKRRPRRPAARRRPSSPPSPPTSTPAGAPRAPTAASACTCPTRATRSASPCRPTGAPTSSSSAAPSPPAAATPPPDPAPAPPRPKAGVAPDWDPWRAAPRAELVPIAWPPARRAGRPGADRPDPARLPLRRGRPAQGHPAPASAAAFARPASKPERSQPDAQGRHVQDHGRRARPQALRPLDPRGGARAVLPARRGGLDPDQPRAQAQSRDRRDPAPDRRRGPRPLGAAPQQRQLHQPPPPRGALPADRQQRHLQGPADRGGRRQLVPVPLHPQGRDRLGLRGLRRLLPLRGRRHPRQHGAHRRVPRRARAHRRPGAAPLRRRQRPRRRRQHRRAPAPLRPAAHPGAVHPALLRRRARRRHRQHREDRPRRRPRLPRRGGDLPRLRLHRPQRRQVAGQAHGRARHREQGAAEGDRPRDGRPAEHAAPQPRQPVARACAT